MPAAQPKLRDYLYTRFVYPILKQKLDYVSRDDLETMGVILQYLDVELGFIGDQEGTARLVPMAAESVQEFLAASGFEGPSEIDGTDIEPRGDEEWVEKDKADPDARFYTAMALHNMAALYVSLWEFPKKTKWVLCNHESTYLQRVRDDGVVCYAMQTICEPYDKSHELDKERPCIVAYQIDMNPLEDTKLLTSELNALICLAIKYDIDPQYRGCDEFVITVITGSDRQVRIAQSKVNLALKTFDVSLSDIFDFDDGLKPNWEEWTTLLGWLAGTMTPRASWG